MTKVYVVRGRHGTKHKYHYDPECRFLRDNELRELTEEEAEVWEKGPCNYCNPDYEIDNSGPSRNPEDVLRDAGFDVG